jgi:hypothetical protein
MFSKCPDCGGRQVRPPDGGACLLTTATTFDWALSPPVQGAKTSGMGYVKEKIWDLAKNVTHKLEII